MRKINKILLVHTGGIGDLIMARPAIQVAYRKYQSSLIDFMGNPVPLKVLMHDKWIHRYIPIPSKNKNIFNIMKILVILLKIRFTNYDYLFLLQPALNKNSYRRLKFFVNVISAKKTIGRRSAFGSNFLDIAVPEKTNVHEVERMIKVVSEDGTEAVNSFEYHLPDSCSGKINHIPIDPNKAFVILSPGGAKPFRRWPADNFIKLANRFESQGIRVVFVGDNQEKDILACRDDQLPKGALNLIGETSLEQLIALIRKSRIVVANDSGPMHLANALNVPVVGIFGSGDVVRTRPYLMEKARIVESPVMDCKPCYDQKCKSPHCMDEISVDGVWNAVIDLLT